MKRSIIICTLLVAIGAAGTAGAAQLIAGKNTPTTRHFGSYTADADGWASGEVRCPDGQVSQGADDRRGRSDLTRRPREAHLCVGNR